MLLQTIIWTLLPLALAQTSGSSNSSAAGPCPYLGQIYAPPTAIASSQIWQNVVSNLTGIFDGLPSEDLQNTSFAIQVVSLHDSAPLFEYYHKSPQHLYGQNGSAPINGDTIFRIASVTKMFSVYALLVNSGFGAFNDPITNYVPELNNLPTNDATLEVDWNDVTVGALASYLAGVLRDYSPGDLAIGPTFQPGSAYGFPNTSYLDPSDVPSCGSPGQPLCTREESINLILKHPPEFPTSYTPSYSNAGFQLFGYVLANLTGQTYDQLMNETVFRPLQLEQTSTTVPSDNTTAVVIPDDPFFTFSLGEEAPAGNMYSSPNDLAKHALAVLNNTQLTATQVRRWLKPLSHTADLYTSVGAPWEILRKPGKSINHITDIYSKSGNFVTYTSQYAIIPDLEVAFVITSLTAMSSITAASLQDLLLPTILQPLYDVAQEQALSVYGGTYVDGREGANSTITINTDNSIGLVITNWISNGTDILAELAALGPALEGGPRLFPSSARSTSQDGTTKVAFRMVIFDVPGMCISWAIVDTTRWASKGIDSAIFETSGGNSSQATAIDLPAWRVSMTRTE